jgi:hypothetical protein
MPAARFRDDRAAPEAPPRYDAYFGMLVTSLVATVIALIVLFLDYNSYPSKPPAIPKATTSLSGGAGAAPQPAGAPQPAPAPQ